MQSTTRRNGRTQGTRRSRRQARTEVPPGERLAVLPRVAARPAPPIPGTGSLAAKFGIDEENLAQRRAFLRLGEEDCAVLASLSGWAEQHAPELSARFYDWQFEFPRTRAFFESFASSQGLPLAKLREHLEVRQAAYLVDCFRGAETGYGVGYFERRLQVGAVHDRINLPLKWYIGSYTEWSRLVSAQLREDLGEEDARRAEVALAKVFNFDIQAIGDAFVLTFLQSMGLAVEEVRTEGGQDRTEQLLQVKQSLTALLTAAQAIAANDLRRQTPLTPISGRLGKAFAEMTENLAAFVGTVGQNAQVLASAAEEMNAVSQQMSASAEETATQADVVSKAADQVSGSVSSVATSSEEMSASIKEIARNAAEAARVALSAVSAAESTNLTVQKLGASGAEIGKVVKVITSIAAQTKLLAINATIEAARAGDAGKGFAVVANEVKELAKETAQATEEIGQRIEAIQADTRSAVAAIEQIGSIIKKINEHQSTIASAVEEQSATTNEIDRSVSGAATGSSEIARNVSGVAEAARHTSQGAADTQKASSELTRMAAELQRMISRFAV
ncbi:MAG TPA: methyl-accepting chemotaxis protein [Anaeromyxobacter sp.]|nr:methyl-accepting chemotaxis protein [Anaeromyxobacter sp.]